MPLQPQDAPRRYVDISNLNFSRWGVWDPAIGPKVGSYGLVNKETGEFDVHGNVYDDKFQKWVDDCDGIKIKDHPPVYVDETDADEEPFKSILTSMWTRKKEFKTPEDAPEGVGSATTKGQWWFQKGHTAAILLMRDPRELMLPGPVLEELFKIPQLKHKHLITRVVRCSAYARYMTSMDGDDITLSLINSEKPNGEHKLEWWSKGCEKGYLKTDVSQTGERCFTAAFHLRQKYPLIRALLRDKLHPDPVPETYWCMTFPPWMPLDEDGLEIPEDDEPDVGAVKHLETLRAADAAKARAVAASA